MFCTQCGEAMKQDGRFCPSCGFDMKSIESHEEVPNTVPIPEEPVIRAALEEESGFQESSAMKNNMLPFIIGAVVLVVGIIIVGMLLSKPKKTKTGFYNNEYNQQLLLGDNGEIITVHGNGKTSKVDIKIPDIGSQYLIPPYSQSGNYTFWFNKETFSDVGDLVAFYGDTPKIVSQDVMYHRVSTSGEWVYYVKETQSNIVNPLHRYNMKTAQDMLLSDTVKYMENLGDGPLAISSNGEYAAFIIEDESSNDEKTTGQDSTVIVNPKGDIVPFVLTEDLKGSYIVPIAIADDGKNMLFKASKSNDPFEKGTLYHRLGGEDIPIGDLKAYQEYTILVNVNCTEFVYAVHTSSYGDDMYFYYKNGKSSKIAEDMEFVYTPNTTLHFDALESSCISLGLDDFSQVVFGDYYEYLYHIRDEEVTKISGYDEFNEDNSDIVFAGDYVFYLRNSNLYRYNLQDGVNSGVVKDVYLYDVDATGEKIYYTPYENENLYILTSDGERELLEKDIYSMYLNNEKDTLYVSSRTGIYAYFNDSDSIEVVNEKEFIDIYDIRVGSGLIYRTENGDVFYVDYDTKPEKIASNIEDVFSNHPKFWNWSTVLYGF